MHRSKRKSTSSVDSDNSDYNLPFRVTSAKEADSLTDGTRLPNSEVILPWIGYGTYKLGGGTSRQCTLQALRNGYRCIDTAFIYGGETTEKQVGLAIQDAISEGMLAREELVVISKHWRKYHGYEPTMECLRLSLNRLELDFIDLWLIHWPGPAWKTMNRRNDVITEHGPWHYASHSKEDIPKLRSETWRAMEDAHKAGKVKAIGVSNFSIAHLERLKETATIWPPAVNQIECHPLYPQTDLINYCAKEGIIVQAYASLGGQDVGKSFWKKVYKGGGKSNKSSEPVTKLWNTPPVLSLANKMNQSPAQILLRWALQKSIALVPKSSTPEHQKENVNIFDFSLSNDQVAKMETELQEALVNAARNEKEEVNSMGRLCWRRDPLRLLDFD